MREFTDGLGRVWKVEMSAPVLARIREFVHEDLSLPTEAKLKAFLRRLADREVILATLQAVFEQQAEAWGIGPAEFLSGFHEPSAIPRAVRDIATELIAQVPEDSARKRMQAEIDWRFKGV